jgi:hypothetical protein
MSDEIGMYLRYPLFFGNPGFSRTYQGRSIVDDHKLTLRCIRPDLFECMDCAEAGIEWTGSREYADEHAKQHERMAIWFRRMILRRQDDFRAS